MKFNLDDLYQIKSGASHKKIYRFKNQNKGIVAVDFSYNHEDYLAFLEVNNFLSTNIEWRPLNKVKLSKELKDKTKFFIETLNDDDDVQRIYTNLDTEEH